MVGAYHPESSGRANMGPDLENMILNPMGVLLCYVDQNLPTKSCYEHTGDHQREPSNDACACKLFAQKKEEVTIFVVTSFSVWEHRDSNPGPSACKA